MKGMQKIKRGTGFGGVLAYAFENDNGELDGELIGGNMVSTDQKSLAREFRNVALLRPDIAKPVWHNSLRLPPGETLNSDKWIEIADEYMKRMGFAEDHQRVYVLHDDDHIHMIANRVSMSDKVYLGQNENLISTQIISQLEKDFDLTITKGPSPDDGGKRRLSKGEIEMALRTEEEPPRQKLQRLIDEVLAGKPTAPQFVEALSLAGVTVVINQASTGRISGASFEVDGIAFKGSGLGKDYSWNALMKRGMDYEQARDSAALERFSAAARNLAAAQGAEAVVVGPAADAAGAGPGAGPAADALDGSRSQGQDLGGAVRPAQRPAAGDARRPDAGDDREGVGELRNRGGEAGAGDRGPDERNQGAGRDSDPQRAGGEEAGEDARAAGRSQSRDDRRIGDDQGADTGPLADDRAGGSSGPDRRSDSGWSGSLARFKAASAARVRSAESAVGTTAAATARPSRIAASVISDARSVDPTPILEAAGYTVKRQGRHLSVRAHGDECFRITRKPDGHFVACDNYENGIGDNIALVQHVSGCGFSEAVHQLTGDYAAAPRVKLPEPRLTPPKLPPETPAAREQGTAYLTGRRITLGTIVEAVKAAFLRFVAGGVVFTGLDADRRVRAATKRSTDPADEVQRRDFKGTDKRYAPILPGNPKSVWIVEGGVDALALHDLAKMRNQEPPTVIVSGGSNVRGFLETPHIRDMLERADRITIAAEREKNIEVQAKTDAQRKKLEEELERLTRKKPTVWTPPHGVKDMAEYHSIEQSKRETPVEQSADNGLQGAGPAPAMPAPQGPTMG